jgi:hypothetical protein
MEATNGGERHGNANGLVLGPKYGVVSLQCRLRAMRS